MQILKIRLKNFKSFYTETTIDFKELTGLWRVSGAIGSGKTSIGEAIIYGLYGKVTNKNNSSLISWGQKHALVELWCVSRGKNLYIKRELNLYGQSPMSVTVDGEPIIFTDKRTAQDQLEKEYLDAPRTTMELLCIISFNNFKSFSSLNTRDTKQFLDDVLGLDALTEYLEATKQIQSELNTQHIKNQAAIELREAQITRMENYEFVDGDIEEVKKHKQELEAELNDFKQQHTQQISIYNAELNTLQQQLTTTLTLGKLKKREIEFIKQGTCPTCGAPIDSTGLSIKEEERAVLMDRYKELSARITDLQARISQINSESTNYITEKLSLLKSQENALIKLTEQSKMSRHNEGEISKLRELTTDLRVQDQRILLDLAEYDQLKQIFQTQIRQKILESFIPAINHKIVELSSMLQFRFVPQFDSSFKCTIRTTNGDIPTSSLSTGQSKMVDMVIILAIISSILSKVQSNVIFLDELFSNLDSGTRTDLISVLRATIPSTSSILIISHQDMDMELFDGQVRMKLEVGEEGQNETRMQITKKIPV